MNWTERLPPAVPERSPTWAEVGVGVLVVVILFVEFWTFGPSSWPAVVLGILVIWIVSGPVATSSIGERIERQAQTADVGTRVLVLGSVLGTVLVVGIWVLPSWLADGAGLGMLLGSLGWLCYHVVSAGEVSGWAAW